MNLKKIKSHFITTKKHKKNYIEKSNNGGLETITKNQEYI